MPTYTDKRKLESDHLPYNVKNVLETGQTDKWGLVFFRKPNIKIFGAIKMKCKFLERVLHQQIDVIHSANSLCLSIYYGRMLFRGAGQENKR
jgi:hypothetical protein